MNSKVIILIGMMGSGKSTIGKILSKDLNIDFLDSDEIIERLEKQKITNIINSKGEEAFRELETKILKDLNNFLINPKDFVLATGGGMVLREENRNILKNLGKVFWLDLSAEKIFENLSEANDRPLLGDKENRLNTIKSLCKIRQEFYEACSDFKINVEDMNHSRIIHEIINKL